MEHDEDPKPQIALNKAAWRAFAIVTVVATLGLIGALVAMTSLGKGPDKTQQDPLTTLALVLAILAFLVQIFVYVFQTNASNSATRRAEEINLDTRNLLTEIQTTSQATQKVLFAQFDRLLDYVVEGSATTEEGQGDLSEETEEISSITEAVRGPASSTPEEWRAMADYLSRSLRPTPRPSFQPSTRSDEDQRIHDYLRAWPDREEAKAVVDQLESLSPIALTLLKRFVDREIVQRFRGEQVGLRPTALPSARQELIDAGFLTEVEDGHALTEDGRRVARLIAAPKARPRPSWEDEVVAPLRRPIGEPGP